MFGGSKGRIRGGSHGEERRRGARTASKRPFQLRNWNCITRNAVREEQAVRPTAEFSCIGFRQAGNDGCDQHGSIHQAIAVVGEDHASTRVTGGPVSVARARHGAVVDNKGSGAESPDWIRSITEITNHVGVLSWIAGSKLAPAGRYGRSGEAVYRSAGGCSFRSVIRTMEGCSSA
jgi:hypothetical protein